MLPLLMRELHPGTFTSQGVDSAFCMLFAAFVGTQVRGVLLSVSAFCMWLNARDGSTLKGLSVRSGTWVSELKVV